MAATNFQLPFTTFRGGEFINSVKELQESLETADNAFFTVVVRNEVGCKTAQKYSEAVKIAQEYTNKYDPKDIFINMIVPEITTVEDLIALGL